METLRMVTKGGRRLIEGDEERIYRRIGCGVVFPMAGSAGCIVLVGESADVDTDFGVPTLHVVAELDEYFGESFREPEPVADALAWCMRDRFVGSRCIWGLVGAHGHVLTTKNRLWAAERSPRVHPSMPGGVESFEQAAAMVRSRIAMQKTLYFHGAAVAGQLSAIPADGRAKWEEFVEMSALALAVAGLDTSRRDVRNANGARRAGIADSKAGY